MPTSPDEARPRVRSAEDPGPAWQVRGRAVRLDRPVIFGVLNVTPDSFSDGGQYVEPAVALRHAERLLDEGADVLDIGGESTRPQGAEPVDAAAEQGRILPVIRALAREHPAVLLSVDTVKASVAEAALSEGAHVINDVSGFRLDADMAGVCVRHGAGVVLMHSRGAVPDMATYVHAAYGPDVTGEVLAELGERLAAARVAGVAADAVVVDPGVGFAKRSEHSLQVLAELPRFAALGRPVIVGVSRKRFIGEVSHVAEPAARTFGTTGANVAALVLGARLFRVHDVRAAREALDVAWEIVRRMPRA